jgi:hypothetical protein
VNATGKKKAAESKDPQPPVATEPSSFGTAKTIRLCREIADMTGGTCLFAFSCGKDGLAAWLWLRQFFKRIVPFYLSGVPHLSFVDRALAYYEDFFQTHIDVFQGPQTVLALKNLIFQPPWDEAAIDAIPIYQYGMADVVEVMRRKYDLPNVWCAYGINDVDSMSRRVYLEQGAGRTMTQRSFYPCYDWKKPELLRILDFYGVKLSADYLWFNRTVNSAINAAQLLGIERDFPEDMAKIENFFPFIRAVIARHEFRWQHFANQPPEDKSIKVAAPSSVSPQS